MVYLVQKTISNNRYNYLHRSQRLNSTKTTSFYVAYVGKKMPTKRVINYYNDVFRKGADFSIKTPPSYEGGGWQNRIAGIPKWKIDMFYQKNFETIYQQTKGRFVLVGGAYNNGKVVRRHPPKSAFKYIQIKNREDLREIVKVHGVDIRPETAFADDTGHTNLLAVDLNAKGGVSDEELRRIVKNVYREMEGLPGSKDVRIVASSDKGFHVLANIDDEMSWVEARDILRKEVYPKVEEEDPHLVSDKIGGGGKHVVFDLSPMEQHGSIRAVGTINSDSKTVVEAVPISRLDSFKPRRFKDVRVSDGEIKFSLISDFKRGQENGDVVLLANDSKDDDSLNSGEYIAEREFDGVRAVVVREKDDIRIYSQKGVDYTERFPEVVKAAESLPRDTILDSEIVHLKPGGSEDFDAVSQRARTKDVLGSRRLAEKYPVNFMVFDILQYRGKDLTASPLTERKEYVHRSLASKPLYLREVPFRLKGKDEMLEESKENGWKGLILKRKNSHYYVGDRPPSKWPENRT